MVEDSEDFGVWLGRQLRRKGMSQSELATELDVTRAAVSAWVSGRATPRLDKMEAIEVILGLQAGSTISRADAPDSDADLYWYHRPAHPDGGRELGNAAAFAFDADLAVLAREATQNSLDERYQLGEPVRVRYTLNEISGERLHRFLETLRWNELEPHFEAAADPKQKVGRVLANGLSELRKSGTLLLLRIDDYNGSGLTGDDYDDGRFAAVVRRQLDSHKDGAAGGSYGLGKATLWATSQLGLVLINSTLSEPYGGRSERRLIGRLDLPWHRVDGGEWAGPAWLGVKDRERDAARSWWADERTTDNLFLTRKSSSPGTSFLIVGAHDPSGEASGLEDMHKQLVKGLGENFWASMIAPTGASPMLEASVTTLRNDAVIVPEEQVDPNRLEPARSRAMQAFLDRTTTQALTSADDVVQGTIMLTVPPLKGDDKAKPITHEAVLLLTTAADDEEKPNHLVGMRSSRMVVIDRPVSDVPMNSPKFQAVLLAGTATGSKALDAEAAERFLRTAEPPEHKDWKKTDDLTATYTRGAISRITEFRQAMLAEIRRILQRPLEEKDDDGPVSLRELLNLDPPPPPRSPGFPTVKRVSGDVGNDGAWRVLVEVRLPERQDPWLLTPVLRFTTRSGPKPEVRWSSLTPDSECEVTEGGNLLFTPGVRAAVFSGISDVTSHPVAAQMAIAEVDLRRVKETKQ
jgi:transcriptional regulator with XRE-family HTH domain